MRILQINTAVNFGSTGRIAEDIGSLLIEKGHESYIAYGRGKSPSQSQKIKIGSKFDISRHIVKTRLFDKHGLGSKKATKVFIRQLEKIKPDVIGLHNLHGYYMNYKVLFQFIKSNQIPVIWTFHDCWPFTGHCTYFDSVCCEKWKTHCQNCPLTKNYPKALKDRSYQNFEDKNIAFLGVKRLKIITPSHWLSKHVKYSFLNDYPVQVIHNGVDLNVFKPNLAYFNNTEKIILGVASIWDERKGLKDFIRLRKILPLHIKIVLIGLTSKQISTLPVGIIGISRTENQQELVKWYNKASVFVNLTYVDNFPTTNIESLACGTPVITYNSGGSPEAIDAQTGYVVEKNDISSACKYILELCGMEKSVISKYCRSRAKQLFDKRKLYLDYLNIFEFMYKN